MNVLREDGFLVSHSHIETGQDFFKRNDFSDYDAIVSNPPFSMRTEVLDRLFNSKVPFAIILNQNGIFDSRKRWELFRDNPFELLIPSGRMSFFNGSKSANPPFQSIYVCSRILPEKIVFAEKRKATK